MVYVFRNHRVKGLRHQSKMSGKIRRQDVKLLGSEKIRSTTDYGCLSSPRVLDTFSRSPLTPQNPRETWNLSMTIPIVRIFPPKDNECEPRTSAAGDASGCETVSVEAHASPQRTRQRPASAGAKIMHAASALPCIVPPSLDDVTRKRPASAEARRKPASEASVHYAPSCFARTTQSRCNPSRREMTAIKKHVERLSKVKLC